MAMYGGLILFGAFLLYDTQKIIHKAERHPVGYGAPPFDPVNASIGIYMDTINIFIRNVSLVLLTSYLANENTNCLNPTLHL